MDNIRVQPDDLDSVEHLTILTKIELVTVNHKMPQMIYYVTI